MIVTYFLNGEPFLFGRVDPMPLVNQIIKIRGILYRVIKRAWFLNEPTPFIAIKRINKKGGPIKSLGIFFG